MTTKDSTALTDMKTNYVPYRKVGASGIAGALTVILMWYLTSQAGFEIGSEVAAAVTTILTFIVGYMVPESLVT